MPYRLMQRTIALALIVVMVLTSSCGGSGGDSPSEVPATSDATTSVAPTKPRPAKETRTTGPTPTEQEPSGSPSSTMEAVQPTQPSASPTPMDPTPTVPEFPTPVPPPPPMTLTGSGSTTTADIAFPVGLAVVTMNHNGTGRFRVRLQTEDLDVDRLIGEGTGIWKGSFGVMLHDAEDYRFTVVADGDWQVDVMWPTPETAPVAEAPFSYSGTGDQAVYFVLVQTGQHTLTLAHDGEGPFSVQPITHEGRRYIDRFSGAGTGTAAIDFVVRDKAFEFLLLNIRAAGNWTITLE